MKQPRDYQVAAATALWNSVHTKPGVRPLIVMPTGSGKSLTQALFIDGMTLTYPTVRIMAVVHTQELVESNYHAYMDMRPSGPAGIYAAGLNRREIRQITFASIDSVASKARAFGRIDFLFVDEAHRIPLKEASNYNKFIKGLREKNPNLIVIGMTATDFRMGSGRLTESGVFDEVVFDLSSGEAFLWMLEQRYLMRLSPKRTQHQVDEEDISIKMGEYDATQSAMAFEAILEPAVNEIITKGQDRQAWLTFAQNIEQAEIITDMLNTKGYPHVAIHSKMKGSREDALAKYLRGEYRGVVNKDILTTGFDDPRIDLIAMMRLTNSVGLWVQMLGRGTRPLWTPGHDISTLEGRMASLAESPKKDCLVLDFAANTTRLGTINYPNVPKKKKGKSQGEPPVRPCPECDELVHISIKACPCCGYVFPEKPKLRAQAASIELIGDYKKPVEPVIEIFGVGQMVASRFQARDPSRPPSIKVDYYCGVRRFSAWLSPESDKIFAKKKAAEWWNMHRLPTDRGPVPDTVDGMLPVIGGLRKPKFIKVDLTGKYPEIIDYDFMGTRFELPPEFGGPPLQEPVKELAFAAALEAKQAETNTDNEAAKAKLREMFSDDIPF